MAYALNYTSTKSSSNNLLANIRFNLQSNPWSENSVKEIKEKANKYIDKALIKNDILNSLVKAEYDINFNYSEFFKQYGPKCHYHMQK